MTQNVIKWIKLSHLKSDELTQTNITSVLLEGKIKVDQIKTA